MGLSRHLAFILVIAVMAIGSNCQTPPRPHIIFILADDMGWNDVSYHGMNEIQTPNIDTLAAAGLVLNNYYSLPICTPSRAALMTGLYPVRTGLQHYVIPDAVPGGLPLNFRILPQRMKDLGYTTRMIGKWHLGFSFKNYTPTLRGFDSHYGYWTGNIDYYMYTSSDQAKGSNFTGAPNRLRNVTVLFNGKDLWNDLSPQRLRSRQYATDLFSDEAIRVINNHNPSVPLFMYMSHLAVHRGNPNVPVISPVSYQLPYLYIRNTTRRNFAGALNDLDQAVGRLFNALYVNDMLEHSIVIFVSDNGAQETGPYTTGGSNYPLRSQKNTNFEGGIKVPAIVWSPNISRGIMTDMMHSVDWLPTLYAAAGGNTGIFVTDQIDGVDQWPAITNPAVSSIRDDFLVNYDTDYNTYAYRNNQYKLVFGDYSYEGNANTPWNSYTGRLNPPPPRQTNSQVLDVLRAYYRNSSLQFTLNLPQINCGGSPPTTAPQCFPNPCIFDIVADPCEYTNIASQNPQLVASLQASMQQVINRGQVVAPISQTRDYASNPNTHCGFWDHWRDSPQNLSATFCRSG